MTERRRVPTQDQLVKREEKRQRWFSVAESLNVQFTGSLSDEFALIGLHSLRKGEWDPRWTKACGELKIPERVFIQQAIGSGLRANYTKVGDFRDPRTEAPATEKPLDPFYAEVLTRLFEQR